MRVWLARHGETEWSLSGQHTGVTDIALTANGEAAARALGHRLAGRRFAAVFVSPLLRARRTCELAGYGDAMTIDPDLAEWNYGADEGRTTPEIRTERPGWSVWRDGASGGETAAEVGARVDRVIERVRNLDGGLDGSLDGGLDGSLDGSGDGDGDGDGDVMLFAHGHVLRVLGARWLGFPPAAGHYLAMSTAAVCILGYERETPVLDRWNDNGTLPTVP